jgi:hypothetical protein
VALGGCLPVICKIIHLLEAYERSARYPFVMQIGAAITLSITVLLALTGYLVTYVINLRLARRKDRLERISRQLSEFYGPLYALQDATNRAWQEMPATNRLPDAKLDEQSLSETDFAAWRRWMTYVFMPLNRQMAEIVVSHADLLIEDRLPACLQDLCAHVVCYEAVIARWQEEDFRSSKHQDHLSVNLFPRETLEPYVTKSFETLKREQNRLIHRVLHTPEG